MSDQSIPDSVTLPCGCRVDCDIVNGQPTFIMTACALGEKCEYVQYVKMESVKQGKPTTILDAR